RPEGGEVPIDAARPGRGWRALAAIADSLVALIVIACLLPLGQAVRSAWPMLVPAGAVVVLGGLLGLVPFPAYAVGIRIALGLQMVVLLALNRPSSYLALFMAVMSLSLVMAGEWIQGVKTVLYRSAGDDWLTYESFARRILETWSLQGGENVF